MRGAAMTSEQLTFQIRRKSWERERRRRRLMRAAIMAVISALAIGYGAAVVIVAQALLGAH